MLSNRPYLLRAFYQWIVDSKCTPILVVDATHPRCKIPQDYVEGDEILFNISPAAIRDYKISNDRVEFNASFSGVIHLISVPVSAVLAIYAEENDEGIFFDAEDDEEGSQTSTIAEVGELNEIANADRPISDGEKKRGRPNLRLVE
jgi:stringent starvation protein B